MLDVATKKYSLNGWAGENVRCSHNTVIQLMDELVKIKDAFITQLLNELTSKTKTFTLKIVWKGHFSSDTPIRE